MHRATHVALACLGLLLGTGGCDTFLTGDKLSQNPNLPTSASAQQLFIGVQAGQFAFQEGTIAMVMCEWVQACSAGNSRFVQQAAQYVVGEGTGIGLTDWTTAYGGGGLIDIRKLEAAVGAVDDSVWLGIGQIWEAFTMGTVSSVWGDVPYSEAVSGKTDPVLDDRFVILGDLQTLLSTAITNLAGPGSGPGANDLIFGGNTAKWTRVAWTLKARYYLQTAESLGAPAYTAAIAAATNGINDATGASDFASFHTTATSERNMWTQFQTSSGFGTDLEGGKALIDILKRRNDPRLAKYYCKATTAAWKAKNRYPKNGAILDPNGNMEQVTAIVDTSKNFSGSTPPTWPTTAGTTTVDSNVTWINRGLPYVGDDFNTSPPPPVSQFNCLPSRFAPDARVPYVSYVENELILAEAYNQTGDDLNGLLHLNNARATVPLSAIVGVTGAALLDSIIIEKYAAMFQNIESINDYRRTCIPALVHSANSEGFQNVPGRLFYPQSERNVNPNVPTPTVQLATRGFRNRGDVHACEHDNSP